MLIFNTTFHVEEKTEKEFLRFFVETYIPTCVDGGMLLEPRFSKIISHVEEGSVCYSLQFYVKNIETLEYWRSHNGAELEEKVGDTFGQSVAGFITLMDEIAV